MIQKLTKEQRQLVEENHGMIYDFIIKHNLNRKEYYDILAIALCNAAKNYRPELGFAFSTYAYRAMSHAVREEFRRQQKLSVIPTERLFSYDAPAFSESEDPLLDFVSSGVNLEEEYLLKDCYNNSMKHFSEFAQSVIRLRAIGYTIEDIKKRLGCSQPYITKTVNKFKNHFIEEYTHAEQSICRPR